MGKSCLGLGLATFDAQAATMPIPEDDCVVCKDWAPLIGGRVVRSLNGCLSVTTSRSVMSA
jgi:hypothetical protein